MKKNDAAKKDAQPQKSAESILKSRMIKVPKKATTKAATEPTKTAYLSKRVLVRVVQHGLKAAATATMEKQGYNVVAENGWVIKVFANGEKEPIKKLNPVKRPSRITLK